MVFVIMKHFLIITGMHRSGTSFLARILNVHGVYLGELEELISNEWQSRYDNPKGHWEHRKIVELAEKTLNLNKGSWHVIPTENKISENMGIEIKECLEEIIKHNSLAAGFKAARLDEDFKIFINNSHRCALS